MAKVVRILCVDDDRATVTIVAAILRREGYEVDTVFSGPEALKIVLEKQYDLIILDVMMPGMDGYQVCARLKANRQTANIAVIMLTARGGVDEPAKEAWEFAGKVKDRLQGFDVGALDYVTKPVKAKELVKRVQAVLWASGVTM